MIDFILGIKQHNLSLDLMNLNSSFELFILMITLPFIFGNDIY